MSESIDSSLPVAMAQTTAFDAELALLSRVLAGSARAMVADGSQTGRLLMAKALHANSFTEVVRVKDGKEAMETLARAPFDLALVDWHLPDMDGLHLLDWIRSEPALKHMVFILLSSEREDRKIIQAGEETHDALLVKPVNSERLKKRLAVIVERRTTAALAGRSLQVGNPDAAIDAYLLAVNENPQSLWPCFGLGDLLFSLKRWEEARRCYERILELDPKALRAELALAHIMEAQGKIKQAQAVLSQLIKKQPWFLRAFDALADSLAAQGQIQAALTVLQGALSGLGQSNADRQVKAAGLYMQLGQLDKAQLALEAALELRPCRNAAGNYLFLARALAGQSKYEDAARCLAQAAGLSRQEENNGLTLEVMLELGQLYLQTNQITEAENLFWSLYEPSVWLFEEKPVTDEELALAIGKICLQNQAWDLARWQLAWCEEHSGYEQSIVEQIEQICREAGAPTLMQQAREDLAQWRQQQVEDLCREGLTLVSMGELEEAEACYRQGLNVDPESGRLYFNLAKLEYRLGRQDMWRQSLKQAVRLGRKNNDLELLDEALRFMQDRPE